MACAIRLFRSVINYVQQQAKQFVTESRQSLPLYSNIFSQSWSTPEWNPFQNLTLLDRGVKHSSLFRYGINCDRKKLYSTAPRLVLIGILSDIIVIISLV